MSRNTLIIIPAFNEGKNIRHVLSELVELGMPVDIVVINDGSTDETQEIVESMQVSIVSHPCNMGYGAALQTGYKFALRHGYEQVIQFDGDGQHSVHDVPKIWFALTTLHADVIIGSRFLDDPNFYPGFLKMLAIRLFRSLIRRITKFTITDPTSGLRGLKRPVFSYYAGFNRFPADYPDADFLIDVLLRRWVVQEVPIQNRQRAFGRSMHTGLKPLMYMLKVILSILVNMANLSITERRQKL